MNINKYQFAQKLREEFKCTHSIATHIIEAYTDILIKELLSGNSVIINRLGTMSLLTRKSRNGVNPKTRKSMVIPEKTTIKFKTFKSTKNFFNGK